MKRLFPATAAGVLTLIALIGTPPPARAIEPCSFLIGYASSKLLDEFVDPFLGKPDTRKLAAEVNRLIQADQAHAAQLGALKARLSQCATKEDVRVAMRDTLAAIDRRLAEQADRIYRLEQEQRALWGEMGSVQKQIADYQAETKRTFEVVNKRLDGHGRQISDLGNRLDEFERVYTRMTPAEQAEVMCLKGLQAYRRSDYPEAARWFQHARGVNEADSGACYYLALCYRGQGKTERAEEMLAEGVARERQHGTPVWFSNTLEFVQGPPREFLNSVRNDPVFGAKVPGARGAVTPTALR
jgi:thioredoxin-like negative regulator of GroEL